MQTLLGLAVLIMLLFYAPYALFQIYLMLRSVMFDGS